MKSSQLSYLDRRSKYQALEKLLKLNWAVLLDSGSQNKNTNNDNNNKIEHYSRYDIFVCYPSLRLTHEKEGLTVESSNYASASIKKDDLKIFENDPLGCMRKLIAELKPPEQLNHDRLEIPFTGGWLGYISYDFGLHQESIIGNSEKSKKFGSPNLPDIRMGLYQWALITDHKNKTTHLYNFGLSHEKFNGLSKKITTEISNGLKRKPQLDVGFSLTTEFRSNLTKQKYQQGFARIKKYIYAGDCYQVNFAQQFDAEFEGSSFYIYRKLALKNNAPFSAYLNFGEQQILSLSPERFIESHQGRVKTQPIKGTRPRHNDPVKDRKLAKELWNSEKDRAENLMIVDLLRNDLSKTAAKGSVQVKELCGVYHFESVHHLISTITSKLDQGFDNFDLLATTLPGGSITGAPKIRAMQIIEALETFKRGIYCGIIGYVDFDGNMDTNICIRTLVADKSKLYCYAGGGIVSDSQMALEYQESFDKLSKILPILNREASKNALFTR